jgi:hypothetical protein
MRGRFRHTVNIMSTALVSDSMGGYTLGSETESQEVAGDIKQLSANRAFALGLTDFKKVFEIEVSKNGVTLTEANSLNIDSEDYTIHSIDETDDFFYKIIAYRK